jgi:hypothetical protein
MKNKDYTSAADLISKQQDKNFYDFQDFGECQAKIDNDMTPKVEIVELPKRYYNKLIKFIKGDK